MARSPDPRRAAGYFAPVSGAKYILLTTSRRDGRAVSTPMHRLLHRSVVLTLDGDSYRLRDHHARADTLRATTTTGTRQPLR